MQCVKHQFVELYALFYWLKKINFSIKKLNNYVAYLYTTEKYTY